MSTGGRRVLAVVLTAAAIAVLAWFVDLSGRGGSPRPEEAYGTWVFDGERARTLLRQDAKAIAGVERAFASTVYVLAPGTIAIGTATAPGTARPCTVEGHPANAFLVAVGDGRERLLFQRDAADGPDHLYLSVPGGAVPFRRIASVP